MKDEISESNKIHFAVMALEASSRKMNISPMEMYQRLKRVDLFKRLVLDCYAYTKFKTCFRGFS